MTTQTTRPHRRRPTEPTQPSHRSQRVQCSQCGQRSRHGQPSQRGEVGSASIWALLLTAGAFTILLGLVVDGGRVIDARLESARAAAQAARVAADALSQSSVRSGGDDVAVGAATRRARSYLNAAGMSGTVQIEANTVTVTVTGHSQTQILSVIGISSFPIQESQTARAITGPDTR